MRRLGPVKARNVERALRGLGYELVRSGGSHRIYRHRVLGKSTTVAFHGGGNVVPKGTVKAILEDIGMDWDEFRQLL